MVLVVLVLVLGLAGAAAVLLLASVAGGRSEGLADFLADLRSGLRRGRADEEAPAPVPAVASQPGQHGVDELFLHGGPVPGYVDFEELSQTLGLATQRAARGVALLTRR
jgi:hypothetical protein